MPTPASARLKTPLERRLARAALEDPETDASAHEKVGGAATGESVVHTHCRICAATCGLEVRVDRAANRVLSIEPDRENPYTWRDFCRKGKTASEVVEHPQRILTPMRRVGDRYEPASWEEAITDIAQRLNRIIDRDGPDAVGLSGGNPLSFSFATTTWWNGLSDAIGSRNRYWVGSVDTNNLHVVMGEMYGSEVFSLVPHLDDCDFFLLVGMDPAVSKFNWLYSCSDGWNRVLRRVHDAGAELVVVDPRRSRSADRATQHVAVMPGQDWALLLGLLKVILDEGLDRPSRTLALSNLDAVRSFVASADLHDLASRCDIPVAVIRSLARRFAGARTAMCLSQTGVSHHEHGTVAEWLSQLLNIVTDRMDVPGGKRFERGFLDAVKIAARFLPDTDHRSRVRDLPTIAGYHSLAELPDEILTPGPGQIRALLVGFGNPVVSAADGGAMDRALADLELLVSFDLVQRESHRHAHWLIPGTHWLERDDLHPLLVNIRDEPFVQYGPRAVEKPPGLMEEWEFITALALAMNRNLFGRPGVNRLIRASRWLATRTGRPGLAMGPEWVQRGMVTAGRGVTWKGILSRPHGWTFAEPRFGDMAGAISTPDKRVACAPPRIMHVASAALRQEPPRSDHALPFVLVNKRSRESMNSWLNESPGMWKRTRGNDLQIHPLDAWELGIRDGDTVRITSAAGELETHATLSDRMRRGVVCMAHGWGSRIYDPSSGVTAADFGANRNVLVGRHEIDPLSQIPKLNSTRVAVRLVKKPDARHAERASAEIST